jgi:hypothetical protein
MDKKIVEMLQLGLEPVGIFFGNTTAQSELEASTDKRNCVVPFLLAAAKKYPRWMKQDAPVPEEL